MYSWTVLGLLNTLFHEPTTLADVGLTQTTTEQVNQTILNLWCNSPMSAATAVRNESADVPSGGSTERHGNRPFADDNRN
eukprot:3933126-Rhodomonas_salina.1